MDTADRARLWLRSRPSVWDRNAAFAALVMAVEGYAAMAVEVSLLSGAGTLKTFQSDILYRSGFWQG